VLVWYLSAGVDVREEQVLESNGWRIHDDKQFKRRLFSGKAASIGACTIPIPCHGQQTSAKARETAPEDPHDFNSGGSRGPEHREATQEVRAVFAKNWQTYIACLEA